LVVREKEVAQRKQHSPDVVPLVAGAEILKKSFLFTSLVSGVRKP